MENNNNTKETAASITKVNKNFAKKKFKKYFDNGRVETNGNGIGCHFIKKTSRADGYVRWTITKEQTLEATGVQQGEKSYYMHHLAWYCADKEMPKPIVEHLSHLCGNPQCCNPAHLVVETPEANNSRKGCPGTINCKHCEEVAYECPHIPKCIKKLH